MNEINKAYIQAMIDQLIDDRNYLLDCFLVKQAEKMKETIEELKQVIK